MWEYERGEGRNKHRWNKDNAGFMPGDKGPIGKCPKSIDQALAEDILNKGIPICDEDDQHPSKIYTQYKGVVYEAAPTCPGKSWHAYPWRGDLPGRAPLPSKIKRHLEAMADKENYLKEYKAWMKQYS